MPENYFIKKKCQINPGDFIGVVDEITSEYVLLDIDNGKMLIYKSSINTIKEISTKKIESSEMGISKMHEMQNALKERYKKSDK